MLQQENLQASQVVEPYVFEGPFATSGHGVERSETSEEQTEGVASLGRRAVPKKA